MKKVEFVKKKHIRICQPASAAAWRNIIEHFIYTESPTEGLVKAISVYFLLKLLRF